MVDAIQQSISIEVDTGLLELKIELIIQLCRFKTTIKFAPKFMNPVFSSGNGMP